MRAQEGSDTDQAVLEEDQVKIEEVSRQLDEVLRFIQRQKDLDNQPPKFDIDDIAPQIEVDELVAEIKTFEKELEEKLPPDVILALKQDEIETDELENEKDDISIEVGRDQSVLILEAETQKVVEDPETYEIVDNEQDVREDEYESLTHLEKTIEIEKNRWEEHEKSTSILEEDTQLTKSEQASEELTNEVESLRFQISQAEKELESISKDELTLTETKQGEEIRLDVVEETKQHEERIDSIEIDFRDYEETEREREEESVQLKETSESLTTEAMRFEETIIDQNLELEDQAEKEVLDKLTEQEEILREEEIEKLPDLIEIQEDIIVDQEVEEFLSTELEHQATEEELEELNELEERVEAALEEIAEIIETKNENQFLEHEDKVQSRIFPPPTIAYLSNEIADIENSLAQLQIEIPIYQSMESIQANYIPQQQSFGLSFDEQVQHDFLINQLHTEIRVLEKMLGDESPHLLERFHAQVEEDVGELLDVETHQTLAELIDSLELVSQRPTLPEPPPYDFRVELEEQENSNRGQLLRSFEDARRELVAASYNFARENQKQVKGPRKSEPLELKRDDLVKVDGKEINLAFSYNNSMLEFTVVYRKLIIYLFLKDIYLKSKSKNVEAVIPRKTEISRIVRSFITKKKIQYTNNIGFGRESIQKTLKELISEGLLEIKVTGFSETRRRIIKSLLMEHNGTNIEDSFHYTLGKIITGFHEVFARRDANKIMINRLIENGVLPSSVDGKKLLSFKKPVQITNWESYSAKIEAFALFERLHSFVITKGQLPSNPYFKTMLKESIKKGKDRFFIKTGELKDILSEAGKDISDKYHMLSETVIGGGKGQHYGLPALNKKFKGIMKDNKSFIHPDLNTAEFKRSVSEHRKNILSISQDIKGTARGKKINVITKASSEGNFTWQWLEQLFVPDIRLTQFIEYEPHTDTGKIYTAIMDDNIIKLEDKPRDYLNRLNTVNKIFHEFMKKGKKVGGGVNDWINEEVFQRIENFTIKKYKGNTIERKIYDEISGNLRSLIGRLKQDNLTRNQFYQFWVETLNEKMSKKG